jgi:ribosomal RNA-processing protein 7
MVKAPREVSGFVALPLTLRSSISPTPESTHYLYLRPHEPKVADEDATRSLFLVNIPVTTTDAHLRYFFSTQLSAGRVEKIQFSENAPGRASVAVGKSARSKKRKRITAEEVEASLDAYALPEVFESSIHMSGASAIVVFVDRPSMELSLKAAKKAAKIEQQIVWGSGIEGKLPSLGLKRYEKFNQLRYPSRRELLRCVDGYMTAYAQMEEALSKENARKRQVPDEDGFITVTRGSKGGLRKEEAKELEIQRKDKSKSFQDFYRFQMREKRKEHQEELLRRFQQDKQRVEEMRKRRGRLDGKDEGVAMEFG